MATERQADPHQQNGARRTPAAAAMSANGYPASPSHPPATAGRPGDAGPAEGARSDHARPAMTRDDDDSARAAGLHGPADAYSRDDGAQCLDHHGQDRDVDQDDQDAADTASSYAATHYPRATSPHGTAMHIYTDDGHTDV